MTNCLKCKYADWKKTSSGKLHPSGDGLCKFPWEMPKLPASMYWFGRGPPTPSGGFISRKKELENHCVYYVKAIL